jgi:hypothetical protein
MSERRSTRRVVTTKAVNYAKDQVFSDNDVFEDSPDEDAPPKRGRGRARKSNSSAAPAVVAEELNDASVYRPPKPVYTEKGYDPSLPPIRERFPFLLEFEADGSPRIDSIVGRRPVDEKEARNEENNDDEGNDAIESDEDSDDEGRRSKRKKASGKKASSLEINQEAPVEYEYLVKYKGRSYLHLEWKTGADLESMNKSTKTLYRRYLKKLQAGLDEDLEDPNFDPSYALPQKIVDMAEQEFTMELSDKELLEWEKEREKVLAEDSSDSEPEVEGLKNGDSAKVREMPAKEVAAPYKPEPEKLKGKNFV